MPEVLTDEEFGVAPASKPLMTDTEFGVGPTPAATSLKRQPDFAGGVPLSQLYANRPSELSDLKQVVTQPLISPEAPFGIGTAAKAASDFLEAGESPMVVPSPIVRAGSGAMKGALEVGEGLTSPLNVALATGTAVTKLPAAIKGLMSAAFGVLGIKQASEASGPLGDAIKRKDWGKAAELAVQVLAGGAQAYFGGKGTKGAVVEGINKMRNTPELVPEVPPGAKTITPEAEPETETPLSETPEAQPKPQEVQNAEGIRANAGQAGAGGAQPETREGTGGANLEQAPPEQPKPVEPGEKEAVTKAGDQNATKEEEKAGVLSEPPPQIGSQGWRIKNIVPEDWKVTPLENGNWVAESPVTSEGGKPGKLVKMHDAKTGKTETIGVEVATPTPKESPQPVVEAKEPAITSPEASGTASGGSAPGATLPQAKVLKAGNVETTSDVVAAQKSKPLGDGGKFSTKVAKEQKKFLLDAADQALKEAPEDPPHVEADTDSAAIAMGNVRHYIADDTKESFEARRLQVLTPLFEKYNIPETSPAIPEVPSLEPGHPAVAAQPAAEYNLDNRIALLNHAIEKARYEQSPKVTIEVPGDGTFEVINSKKTIRDFQERAARFPTTAPRASKPTGSRSTPTPAVPTGKLDKESALKALAPVVSDDPTRPVIHNVWSDGKTTVATNGRMLTKISTGVGGTAKKPVMFSVEGKPVKTELTYPNWKQVIPDKQPNKLKNIDTEKLFTVLRQAQEATIERYESVKLYRDKAGNIGLSAESPGVGSYEHEVAGKAPFIALNPQYLINALNAARRVGDTKISLEYTDHESPITVRSDHTESVIMPIKMEDLGPATGEGPGASKIGLPGQDQPQIQQLKESFENIRGQKVPFGQKVREAFAVGQKLSKAKDAVATGVAGLKASGDYLIDRFNGIQNIDDLLRAKGDLSAALEQRGWLNRQFEKLVKRQMPNLKERAAVAKWVDAGGDIAELARGEREAPAEYKQAYRDAQNLSPDAKVAAENIRNYFDARLDEAIDAGVLEHGVEDYIHRIYERDPAKLKKALAYVQSGILSKDPALAKKRVFQFDWEAEKMGLKPVQDFLPRVAQYESSLSRAIAAREFIRQVLGKTKNGRTVGAMRAADGRPVLAVGGLGIPVEDPSGVREATLINPHFASEGKTALGNRRDYLERDYPALKKWKWVQETEAGTPIYVQGDLLVHPDMAGRIDALLEPSRVRYGRYPRLGQGALAVSSTFKNTMLDFSGFHQVQLALHALEHKVNPFNLVKDIDFNDPKVNGLLKGGITLGGDYMQSHYGEGLFGGSLSRHIPFLGPLGESYHKWLFQDYIPRLKMTMAQAALERNRARFPGMSDEQLYAKTASQANAAFGEQNYIMLERSKTAQDMARLIMLAPDFLEARGRFAGQALQKGGKFGGNEQRAALLLGAVTMYVTARLLNKAISGQYHNEPENLFSVVYNGKSYNLRTVQGDILHMLSNPLQFWMHRLNPTTTRIAFEALSGRDEFGRKRSYPEQAWDAVSTAIPISLRSSRERGIMESLSNGFGLSARRWNDVDDAFKLAQKWKDAHGVREPGEFIYDPDKDPLRPLKIALSQNDEGKVTAEIKKLVDSGAYTIPKLSQHFNRYAALPFTGSRRNDAQWEKTLSEDQLKTVETAKEHKRQLLKLYRDAARKYLESGRQQFVAQSR